MGTWVRYSMWDRWRDLTRFRLACEMALASYRTYVNDFPVSSPSPLVVHDPSGDSGFKCDLDDFRKVLNDDEALYRALYPTYVALIEDLGRELIERLLTEMRVTTADFPGMKAANPAEAAERYVTGMAVEVWAEALLKRCNRSWSDFKGGKRALVEAVTVRNLFAHGIPVFNQTAVNRIAAAGGRKAPPKEGDPIKLDKTLFAKYVATLRLFARVLADGVSNLLAAT